MSTEVKPQEQQPKHQHISWRRERIAELSAQGRTEREIATILKVGLGSVSRDLSYLNKQACDSLKFHIQERLPAQYRECQNGLEQVLKMAWNIVSLESANQSNKLQALSLISDCYKHQMDLSTNAGIISEAMRFVSQKADQVNTLYKLDERIESFQSIEEDKTTNGVF